MLHGQQVFPHKYLKRIQKNGKWVYVYRDDNKPADLTGLQVHQLVVAHQPTTILTAADSTIVYGPPQAMGKVLLVNTNPARRYRAIARNRDGSGAVYFYPAGILETVKAKKAAKFLHANRAIGVIDRTSEDMMRHFHPESQQYGLAMWLNNHTYLRIGAHEDAQSVDVTERRKIINQARTEGWSDKAKEEALKSASSQTFGLLTTRVGHVTLNPAESTASWRFRGKGGKMITGDMVNVKLPPLQYNTLHRLMAGKPADAKIFPDVKYKTIWRHYKRYGITPHTVRGAFADKRVREIVDAFIAEKPKESVEASMTRLRKEIKEKVSDKLGHSADMTMRAYVSETTRKGYQEALELRHHGMQESFQNPDTPWGVALAKTIIWLEIGPGNEVI